MGEVAWSNELRIGITQVDDEHKNLVMVLNQLDAAMKAGKETRVMSDILNQLIDYPVHHFASEEKLMEDSGYPKTKLHKAQHKQLVDKFLYISKL